LKKSLDALILFILVTARIRIDTLADAVLPQRHDDVRRLVEGWWPAWSLDLLAHPETDPVSMLLMAAALGLLAVYLAVDLLAADRHSKTTHRFKLGLIFGLIGLLVFGKTILLINLRHLQGPASYAHDGGVIQTEAAIDFFVRGLNPYVEDYTNTPMAEWGFSEYRTALYHYPYLPWTFIFSTPFYLAGQLTLGWFDQRMVYLLLFAVTLILTPRLAASPQTGRIALAVMGLNPIAGTSLIFGENDLFVLGWIVPALWLLHSSGGRLTSRRALAASAVLGLACASKPTAWFLAPFWLLYLLHDGWGSRLMPPVSRWPVLLTTLLRRAWPLPTVSLLIIGPWLVWNPAALYDDVWRWSAGLGPTGYQIWGWGAGNFVLALGWVSSRFDYWPFTIPGALVSGPLLGLLLWRQARANTMAAMLYGSVVLLLAFFYVSRFLQPNYLGYLLGLAVLAIVIEETATS
jgi:hypothetical protein